MRQLTLSFLFLTLVGCVTQPNFNKVVGGGSFSQAGLTYTTSDNFEWNVLTQHTYRTNLAAFGSDRNESYIISTTTFNIPPNQTGQQFLDFVKSERAKEPQTGRFENIKESISLYAARKEICANFSSLSKDYGAKRSGEYALYETYGMYCIHPYNDSIGVFIELSRKAPFSKSESPINKNGEKLLKSVKFSDFKV
jgi:hypothetical protein